MASFCQSGQEFHLYAEVGDDAADLDVLIFARAAKDEALRALGLDPDSVELRFYRSSDFSEIGSNFTAHAASRGFFKRGKAEVLALIGKSVAQTIETVAHECRHYHQDTNCVFQPS